MEKNYFEVISESVSESVRGKGFECIKSPNEYLLKNQDDSYKITYKEEQQIVCLDRIGGSGKYKNLSSWSIGSKEFTQKDVEMICKDFVQCIIGEGKKSHRQLRAKAEDDESSIDSVFFANRMANVFPQLKEEVRIEKECYTEFRGVNFTKSKILPCINALLSSGKEKSKLQKLFKVMSELYENGTLDVRSIITMVILNGIEGEKQIKFTEELISEKLKKAWYESRKYKGKKVKPEKPKRKSNFISRTLANS